MSMLFSKNKAIIQVVMCIAKIKKVKGHLDIHVNVLFSEFVFRSKACA